MEAKIVKKGGKKDRKEEGELEIVKKKVKIG